MLSSSQKESLRKIVRSFKKARILVVGDIILDEYLLGSPERISREAPVIILNHVGSDYALGGAGNAAANIAALGGNVTLLGLSGDDDGAERITKLAEQMHIALELIKDPKRRTTIKTRVISTSNQNPDSGTRVKQQVLRLDRQDRFAISAETESELTMSFKRLVGAADIVLISDYNSGLLTPSSSKKIIEIAKNQNKRVIVDSTGDFNKFIGAYSLTPNQPDAESMLKRSIEGEEDLLKAGIELMDKISSEEILLTRGAKGMALFKRGSEPNLIPAFNIVEVFDVTGAGDTVAASYSLGLACAATSHDSALLGNLAASLVVRKYGTATCSSSELLEALN